MSDRASQMFEAALRDGQENLSQGEEIRFLRYTRTILPIDGYVFWSPTEPLKVKGSLHHSQTIQQNEDEIFGSADVMFSSEKRITQFSESPISTIYVAERGGFRYAFSQQQGFYSEAQLWHYFGHSIPPALATQLLDAPNKIDLTRAITSNSLALWLALNNYQTPYFDGFSNNLALFPSMAVTPNLTPPYASVHIGEDDTRSLQQFPRGVMIDSDSGKPLRIHTQLMSDRVRIVLYGLQHNEAMDFLDCVLDYSVNTGNFGIMNMPVVRDAKRTLPEIQALAMKKVIDFEISYYQQRARTVAEQQIMRQLILSAPFQVLLRDPIQPSVVTGGVGTQDIVTDSHGGGVTSVLLQ